MAGITDHGFRSFMKKLGAGIVISELVSATGISYKSTRTLQLTRFDESQRPVGIQLFGEDPLTMAEAARFVEDLGADFVDLNFGCPVPKVVKKGAGSALLKDLPAMGQLLSEVVAAVKIPVTIKIRTGWEASCRNAEDVAALAANEGIAWVAIHGRTRAQAYGGQADWDYIARVKERARLPILGNGDILTPAQAVSRLRQSGVDGVMIGRGALKNPYLFREALALWRQVAPEKASENAPENAPENALKTGPASQDLVRDYPGLVEMLVDSIAPHCDERILQIQLKKFAAWFATGYPNAAQFRKSLYQSADTQDLVLLAREYFASVQELQPADTSAEAFLMGGHG
ncbi:MAG: tRNA dihydrouridine synthase DusB [Bdellovibrio sp.]|nr:MAG: tRNA dihydrouridine synthase DusB [Bdellovibrio sp.]